MHLQLELRPFLLLAVELQTDSLKCLLFAAQVTTNTLNEPLKCLVAFFEALLAFSELQELHLLQLHALHDQIQRGRRLARGGHCRAPTAIATRRRRRRWVPSQPSPRLALRLPPP